MAVRTERINYLGREEILAVYFTFSFRGKTYAAIEDSGDNARIVRLKWSLIKGTYVDSETVDDTAGSIAGYICSRTGGSNLLFKGEHYHVALSGNRPDIRIAGKCLYFTSLSTMIPFTIVVLATVLVTVNEIRAYFKSHSDWIIFVNSTDSATRLCMIITLLTGAVLYLLPDKGKPFLSLRTILNAALIPLAFFLFFGFVVRPVIRIAVIIVFILFAAHLIYNLVKIGKLQSKQHKVRARRRLREIQSRAFPAAITAIAVISVAVGALFPYTRNPYPSKADVKRMEETCLSACESLNAESWKKLSESERIDLLQIIADYECARCGSYSAKVLCDDLSEPDGEKTNGCFYNNYNAIFIDREELMESAVTDVLNTLLHEGRHCWQESYASSSESDFAGLIKENNENYKSTDYYSYEDYHGQLVEVDARYYASTRIHEFYKDYLTDMECSGFVLSDCPENYAVGTHDENDDWSYSICVPYPPDSSPDIEKYIALEKYKGAEEEVTLPASIDGIPVKAIYNEVFGQGRETIKTLNIPAGITEIGTGAFSGCNKMTINIDPANKHYRVCDGVLVSEAEHKILFVEKTKSGSVVIPEDVEKIGLYAFEGSNLLTAIEVEPGNKCFRSTGGILYDTSDGSLIHCPAGRKGRVEIDPECTGIAESAFYNCDGITDIVIPPSVRTIGGLAFSGCDSLKALIIPETVEYICPLTFCMAKNLEKIDISSKTVCRACENEEAFGTDIRIQGTPVRVINYDGPYSAWKESTFVFENGGKGYIKYDVTVNCSDRSFKVTNYIYS